MTTEIVTNDSQSQIKEKSSEEILADGFVIFGLDEINRKEQVRREEQAKLKEKQVVVRVPNYSDEFLAANARFVAKSWAVEPIFEQGKQTGQYRAYRRCRGRHETAIFADRDDAFRWGRQTERKEDRECPMKDN